MLKKAASAVYLDFAPRHRQPPALRILLATVVAIVGSLVADALLVIVGETVFPGTKGYQHFQFGDYAKLTVIGVIIACVAWPVTTRITSRPQWMFGWMAVIVTVVLWLPDVYILTQGQPGNAVGVLFVMHMAIALVTYSALVLLAPVRAPDRSTVRPVETLPR
jgi:hypothetical protein